MHVGCTGFPIQYKLQIASHPSQNDIHFSPIFGQRPLTALLPTNGKTTS